jgi:predicted nuclease with RNAse H fold
MSQDILRGLSVINTIIGLDLAATFQKKKVGVAVVNNQGDAFALTSVQLLKSTDEILDSVRKAEPPVLSAIDAPLKLPLSDNPYESNTRDMELQWPMVYTYRPWEYLIFEKLRKEYRISGRPFSSLTITYRAQILRRLLEMRGWKLVSSPEQMTNRC